METFEVKICSKTKEITLKSSLLSKIKKKFTFKNPRHRSSGPNIVDTEKIVVREKYGSLRNNVVSETFENVTNWKKCGIEDKNTNISHIPTGCLF